MASACVSEPAAEVVARVGAHHLDVHRRKGATGKAVDHADAAAGDAGIDTEHTHASTSLPATTDMSNGRSSQLRSAARPCPARHAAPRTVVAVSIYDLGKARRRRRAVRPSPLFLAFVALTALGGVLAWAENGVGSRLGDLGVFVFVLAGWVVSLCLHEFAHAYAAYRAGDRSVESAGYLTLNPVKYAHPLLSIVLPLFFIVLGGIGLPGGAVYLHPHAFRTKRAQSLAAAVGPATNVVFAVVLLGLVRAYGDAAHLRFWSALAFLGFLQVTAAVLNILPIPGLDGYGIIEPYLDQQTRSYGDRVKPWGMIGVIVLLQFQTLNTAFFTLADKVYELSGAAEILRVFGRAYFEFWVKNPF